LAADWIAFYQLPADPVREDRRQHVLDLQLGSIRALDFVLLSNHAVGKMTVPIRFDPVLDVLMYDLFALRADFDKRDSSSLR
jgi:hypothetical protein